MKLAILFALWRRWLPALAAGIIISTFFASFAVAQAPDLMEATTTSGLSIHHDFYEELANDVVASNGGRTALLDGNEFQPYTGRLQDLANQITDQFNIGFAAGMAYLLALLPTLIGIIIALIAAILCGGVDPQVSVTFPTAAVVGAYTMEGLDVTQISNGQQIDISASSVGMLSEFITEVTIGSCPVEEDDAELYFVYGAVDYRAIIEFLPGGGSDVTVYLQGGLPAVDKLFNEEPGTEADLLWQTANTNIGGEDLEDKLIAFATVDVPESLKIFLETNWVPYLAQPGWLVDLSGSKQSIKYAQNQVSGYVGEANYLPLLSNATADKYQLTFTNSHSAVTSDPIAVCADGSRFDSGPYAEPYYAAENPQAEGTYHTSSKTLEHRVLAALRSGVGTRDPNKVGSDYIVDHSLSDLVPEAGAYDLNYLFTDPNSPIGDFSMDEIPLSPAQVSGMLATRGLGSETLGALRLRIKVCEVSKTNTILPFGTNPSAGMLTHKVYLVATIEREGAVLLNEVYRAEFNGELLLSKLPREDSLELQTVRADLDVLNSRGIPSDTPFDQIDESTPFEKSPVSLLLRGLFGDPDRSPFEYEPRVRYAIEGLAGPLVERSAHAQIVLPGLDFPAFDGPRQFIIASAAGYHSDDFVLGFEFDRKALCAEIVRWGTTPAMVGGVISPNDQMLVVEVNWMKVNPPNPNMKTRTAVGVTAATSVMTPQLQENPARFDAGYLVVNYMPANGDETRVMNMSGDRLGAYLPGGGTHFSAATPAGYTAMRLGNTDPRATFELVPYRGGPVDTPCNELFPGPIRDTSVMNEGEHHEDGMFADIYEALTFESRKLCKGPGRCDGVRLVAMWNAPLFHGCPGPDGPFDKDEYTFETVEGTLRVPPSEYVFMVQNCDGPGRPPRGGPIGPDLFD